MLVFRNGSWHDIEVVLLDPIFTENHRMEAAAIILSLMDKGKGLAYATARAEELLYMRLFPGLILSRDEHHSPKNKEE